jgi:3',5'-cyclic AMP phosphodiesterase CpdA
VFVLAHLSDPHLSPIPRPRLAELASKRLLGYANWQAQRRLIHRTEALEAIVADLHAARPDHIAVTGDLVNIALPGEFERARRWLDGLGRPGEVSLVPGNHDAYVAAAALHRERYWAPYLAEGQGEPAARAEARPATPFPTLRRRGAIAFIGLSTALATRPFMATGALGQTQNARCADMLVALGKTGLFRVIMIHHPPLPTPSRHKRLIDAAALREAIALAGAELLIHGHHHVRSFAWLPSPIARTAVIGVPSASAASGGKHEAAAYNLYRIDGSPGCWHCEVSSRGLQADGTVAEIDRFSLSWP